MGTSWADGDLLDESLRSDEVVPDYPAEDDPVDLEDVAGAELNPFDDDDSLALSEVDEVSENEEGIYQDAQNLYFSHMPRVPGTNFRFQIGELAYAMWHGEISMVIIHYASQKLVTWPGVVKQRATVVRKNNSKRPRQRHLSGPASLQKGELEDPGPKGVGTRSRGGKKNQSTGPVTAEPVKEDDLQDIDKQLMKIELQSKEEHPSMELEPQQPKRRGRKPKKLEPPVETGAVEPVKERKRRGRKPKNLEAAAQTEAIEPVKEKKRRGRKPKQEKLALESEVIERDTARCKDSYDVGLNDIVLDPDDLAIESLSDEGLFRDLFEDLGWVDELRDAVKPRGAREALQEKKEHTDLHGHPDCEKMQLDPVTSEDAMEVEAMSIKKDDDSEEQKQEHLVEGPDPALPVTELCSWIQDEEINNDEDCDMPMEHIFDGKMDSTLEGKRGHPSGRESEREEANYNKGSIPRGSDFEIEIEDTEFARRSSPGAESMQIGEGKRGDTISKTSGNKGTVQGTSRSVKKRTGDVNKRHVTFSDESQSFTDDYTRDLYLESNAVKALPLRLDETEPVNRKLDPIPAADDGPTNTEVVTRSYMVPIYYVSFPGYKKRCAQSYRFWVKEKDLIKYDMVRPTQKMGNRPYLELRPPEDGSGKGVNWDPRKVEELNNYVFNKVYNSYDRTNVARVYNIGAINLPWHIPINLQRLVDQQKKEVMKKSDVKINVYSADVKSDFYHPPLMERLSAYAIIQNFKYILLTMAYILKNPGQRNARVLAARARASKEKVSRGRGRGRGGRGRAARGRGSRGGRTRGRGARGRGTCSVGISANTSPTDSHLTDESIRDGDDSNTHCMTTRSKGGRDTSPDASVALNQSLDDRMPDLTMQSSESFGDSSTHLIMQRSQEIVDISPLLMVTEGQNATDEANDSEDAATKGFCEGTTAEIGSTGRGRGRGGRTARGRGSRGRGSRGRRARGSNNSKNSNNGKRVPSSQLYNRSLRNMGMGDTRITSLRLLDRFQTADTYGITAEQFRDMFVMNIYWLDVYLKWMNNFFLDHCCYNQKEHEYITMLKQTMGKPLCRVLGLEHLARLFCFNPMYNELLRNIYKDNTRCTSYSPITQLLIFYISFIYKDYMHNQTYDLSHVRERRRRVRLRQRRRKR